MGCEGDVRRLTQRVDRGGTALSSLLRRYFNALFKRNPVVVAATVIGVVSLCKGPFYDGLASHYPAAIGIVVLIISGILIVLAVAIIDRSNRIVTARRAMLFISMCVVGLGTTLGVRAVRIMWDAARYEQLERTWRRRSESARESPQSIGGAAA